MDLSEEPRACSAAASARNRKGSCVEALKGRWAGSVDEAVRGAYDTRQALPWCYIPRKTAKEGVIMRRLTIIGLAVALMAGVAAVTISQAGADSEEATLRTLVPKV